MPRLLPSQVLHFIARTAVIVLLTAHSSAFAQQKTTPPSPSSQAQLEARVKDLETRLNAAEQKAEKATMEKDYITRVQTQYERYYEKAFNTQVTILSVIALFITIVFGIAARFGFGIFDRAIQLKLTEASTQLRTEFTQLLEKETQTLREANAAQLTRLDDTLTSRIGELEKDIDIRSRFHVLFVQGLAEAADKRYDDARNSFRRALVIYKSSKGRPRLLIEKKAGVAAAKNVFFSLNVEDEANFAVKAKMELADELYSDLEDELAGAALSLDGLAALLLERKSAPSPAVATEPKTGEAKSNVTQPVPPPIDAK
jgi:cell division protein FtsB